MTRLPSLSALEEWRRQKDEYLATSPLSPLRGAAGGVGLSYYPEDEAARVEAAVARPERPEPVLLGTSSGEERMYVEYGVARFELGGEVHELTVYADPAEPDGPRLFMPFKDATSGGETYGAGRYLEPHLLNTEPPMLLLDFNYAYHPYCAYAEGYSCAFPPAQNRLSVGVRAGERLPAGGQE